LVIVKPSGASPEFILLNLRRKGNWRERRFAESHSGLVEEISFGLNAAVTNITLRPGKPEDVKVCATICYEAFKRISEAHDFTPDIPSVEVAAEVLGWMFSHPGFYTVVAEANGRIVGTNVLDERNDIAGVGPITVDPSVQNQMIGRRLMEDVMARAAEKEFPGVRLVQAAFHNRSLSLYAKLGFDVREPLACMQGPALNIQVPGCAVRPAKEADLIACERVCRQVHGHGRRGELLDAIHRGTATVVEHFGRITGCASIVGFFGYAVGETNAELKALIGAAPGFLLPTRNAELFRWCLAHGLRVTQPMTLMSTGLYNQPTGSFLASITY
jgi:N-acetylglutamate synthase-like GNAT family acetyltransferase